MAFSDWADERIGRFYGYWSGLRQGAAVPSVRVFDPIDIAPLLQYIWLARWDEEKQDFVYRLAGESVLAANRRQMRHQSLAEIYGDKTASRLRSRYQRICSTPLLFHSSGSVYDHLNRFGNGERLVLPLSDEAGRRTVVVGCTIYAVNHRAIDQATNTEILLPPTNAFFSLDGEPMQGIKEAC
jgi:hypothetical protein